MVTAGRGAQWPRNILRRHLGRCDECSERSWHSRALRMMESAGSSRPLQHLALLCVCGFSISSSYLPSLLLPIAAPLSPLVPCAPTLRSSYSADTSSNPTSRPSSSPPTSPSAPCPPSPQSRQRASRARRRRRGPRPTTASASTTRLRSSRTRAASGSRGLRRSLPVRLGRPSRRRRQ